MAQFLLSSMTNYTACFWLTDKQTNFTFVQLCDKNRMIIHQFVQLCLVRVAINSRSRPRFLEADFCSSIHYQVRNGRLGRQEIQAVQLGTIWGLLKSSRWVCIFNFSGKFCISCFVWCCFLSTERFSLWKYMAVIAFVILTMYIISIFNICCDIKD